MNKRTCIKLLAVLVALCLLFTTLPGAAVQVNAAPLAEVSEETVFQLDADCQILDYVHEDVFNEGNHIARLTEEETPDTYVFRNKDGTKTVYYLDEAVKYRDASGTVREKNLELVAGLTGYSTMQNDVQLHIPTNAASGIQLSYSGYDVSIVPQGGRVNPVAQRGDKSVGYPNFYGSGTALVYTPTLSGVKEDIILAQYTGVSEFTFQLNTDGLNLYHTPKDRYYLAQTEEAEMKIWLGNIEIFDAAAKPSMGTLTVETVTAGQQYRLTISADVDFLTDPDTVYPVTIDPTITVSDNNNGAGTILDAPIYEGYSTSNFGTYQYDRAGYAGTSYLRGRTVVRLTGLLSNSAYSAATEYTINSVIFYIADAGGSSTTVNLHPLTSNSTWTESNVTWSNVGTYAGTAYASNTVSNGGYASFNITALTRAWKNGTYNGNCGFILVGASESSVDKSLYSCEHSTSSMRPYVVVTYNENISSPCNDDPYINEKITDEPLDLRRKDNALQFRANCYGYAFRFFYSGSLYYTSLLTKSVYSLVDDSGEESADFYCYKQQPGEFAAKSSELVIYNSDGYRIMTIRNYGYLYHFYENYFKDSNRSNADRMCFMEQLLRADANTLGYELEEYTGTIAPSASSNTGKRLIAVVVGADDYHFYMQHSDNTWSHKPGEAEPRTYSLSPTNSVTLTNSNIYTCAAEGQYEDGLVKFFYISKSDTIDCAHIYGRDDSCLGTTLCYDSNAKAVGDSISTAENLGSTLLAQVTGVCDYFNDLDYFHFRPNTSKTVTIDVAINNTSPEIRIVDANGNILYSSGPLNNSISFTYYVSSNTDYYICIMGTTTLTNSSEYTLRIS